MKLFYSETSPYARKTRVTMLEKGLAARVETIVQYPFADCPDLVAANPLKRIPTLIADNGHAIFDSPVICAYFDAIGEGPALIPQGPTRWAVLTAEAMADGILDAAFATVMERRRPAEQQSAEWFDRWQSAIERSLEHAQANIETYTGDLSLAQIALACALGYLDYRLPERDWRQNRPALTTWFNAFSQRPSMQATTPPVG